VDVPDEATASARRRDGSAAALASAVLDEEAARQEAQARASEQVIFPDDIASGRRSEPSTSARRSPRGGKADVRRARAADLARQLTLNAVQTIEPS